MRTKNVPEKVVNAIKRWPSLYRFLRTVRFTVGGWMGARQVDGLPGRIHYNDFMLDSTDTRDVDDYKRGAQHFVGLLADTLKAHSRDWGSVRHCLEIGCGYGRIIRFLVKKIPPHRVVVCDAIDEGAKFCEKEFGVGYRRVNDFSRLRNGAGFDLVYLCSVFSHLDLPDAVDLWMNIVNVTEENGLIVLTTHGAISANKAEEYGSHWAHRKADILAQLSKTGFYYEKYPWYRENYGMTWYSKDFFDSSVRETVPDEIELIAYGDAALDGHQDLYVYKKIASAQS